MIDFKLKENGDIDIAEAYQYPYFIIEYYVPVRDQRNINNIRKEARRYPTFKIDFDTDIKQHQQIDNRFLIKIYTEKRILPFRSVFVESVRDNEELAQEVTIRLKTEQGEFQYLKELGSQLVTLRHSDIKSETTKELARQYTEEAISDVNFEEEYDINVNWEDDISRYKHERLKLTIDTDRDTIYEAAI